MRVLITGSFGNVGIAVMKEFLSRNHEVTVFELKTKKTEKIAKQYAKDITMAWGNILEPESIKKAIQEKDVVIHLVGLIPPMSEENRDLCFKLNVQGTVNVLQTIKETGNRARLIFTSSASVMGPTQEKQPPICPYDPPVPTSNYTESKIEAEQAIAKSGVTYCICRLGAVLSSQAKVDIGIARNAFDMNLNNRLEAVLDLDVATAIANAAELLVHGDEIHGKILNIGGGKENGFQIRGRDMSLSIFERMGMGTLNEECFNKGNYFLDWMDTGESQKLLQFQNHTFDEGMRIFLAPYKKFKPFIRLFAPLLRRWLEKKSPYCTDQ